MCWPFSVQGRRYPFGKTAWLLLTQHMANLGLMTLPEQHRLYTLFADYLFPKGSQLVIKPHPDDIAGTYHRVFGEDAVVLPFAMPSELMAYCIRGRFQKAAAAYSTSVRSMGHIADETLCFDSRILQDWRYLPLYDCAVRFLQASGYPGSGNRWGRGIAPGALPVFRKGNRFLPSRGAVPLRPGPGHQRFGREKRKRRST